MTNTKDKQNPHKDLLEKILDRLPGQTYDLKSYGDIAKKFVGKLCVFAGNIQKAADGTVNEPFALMTTILGISARNSDIVLTLSSEDNNGHNYKLRWEREHNSWSTYTAVSVGHQYVKGSLRIIEDNK